MKLYKSYILAGLIALGFTACDTDDLERDINALKDRVENYEAQVQKLNDDMNIIRVMLDGNKTISEWSYDGSKYTLKLSNGETLTLSNGVVGDTNYPSIEISENGNWIIAGEDTGIRAVAKDGEDAEFTPQFKIENGNWFVSHDDGVTWTDLGVKATGTPTDATSPISGIDTSNPDYITITLASGDYSIPVVKNLTCAIQKTDLADDGLLYLGYGEGITIKVDVNIESGDIIRPVVPADWKAEILTDYSNSTGPKTLDVIVTAPASASKCVVTIEVNRGATTITDEIVARTETKSYYDDYIAGLDIEIGGVKINRRDYKNFKLISQPSDLTNTSFNDNTLYFISCDLTVNKKQRVNNSLIIIGDNVDSKCKLTLDTSNGYIALNPEANSSKGLLLKNIEVTESSNKNYIMCFEGTAGERYIENLVFDDCLIKLNASGNNRAIVNVAEKYDKEAILNFSIVNSIVKLQQETTDNRVLNIANVNTGFSSKGKYNFKNNLLYCSKSEGSNVTPVSASVKLLTYAGKSYNIDISNNTFVNVLPDASQAYIQVNPDVNSKFVKNIIFVESSWENNCYIMNPGETPQNPDNFTDNLFYDVNTLTWKTFRNNPPEGFKNEISLLGEEPFTDKLYSIDNFTYNLKENYKEYGSNLYSN